MRHILEECSGCRVIEIPCRMTLVVKSGSSQLGSHVTKLLHDSKKMASTMAPKKVPGIACWLQLCAGAVLVNAGVMQI